MTRAQLDQLVAELQEMAQSYSDNGLMQNGADVALGIMIAAGLVKYAAERDDDDEPQAPPRAQA